MTTAHAHERVFEPVGCVNSVRRVDLWICREIGFMDHGAASAPSGAGGQRHRNR
jgi:hypothetical protein